MFMASRKFWGYPFSYFVKGNIILAKATKNDGRREDMDYEAGQSRNGETGELSLAVMRIFRL